jgi:HEAT repeat protein
MSQSITQLLAELQDPSANISDERLAELSDLGKQAAQAFATSWKQVDTQRRREIVQTLGRLADEFIELTFEAINLLAVQDRDGEVRRLAIQNLWECTDPKLIEPLLQSVREDQNVSVRSAAATALGRYVWLGEIDEILPEQLRLVEDELLKTIETDDEEIVQRMAIESLGYSSRVEVGPIIETAFQSASEAFRRSAIFAMGRSANVVWSTQVLISLTDSSPEIRREAARAAGELEIKGAIEPLIELLDDVDDEVRAAAIWSLGQLGGSQAEEALLALLDQSDDDALTKLIQDALEYLAFVDGTADFPFLGIDEEPGTTL